LTRSTSSAERARSGGRTLVIDTTSAACSLALFDGDTLIEARHEQLGRGHAERLIPLIATLPDGGRATRILVGCGPGSFTGIRVGVAAARAFGLGWDAPVTGYSTLALLAATAVPLLADCAEIGVAMLGGHGEYFVQAFSARDLSALAPAESLPPASAALTLGAHFVTGNAAHELIARRGHGVEISSEICAANANLLPADARNLPPKPIYVRGADATPMAAK
jgi:tRNA threonylcarbamoyl adenosine modification protein YeaZ